jgi:segregation and condensation protein B
MLTPPAALEALLFATGDPIEKKQLMKLLAIKESELALTIEALEKQLEGRGVTIIETATELEMRTSAEAAEIVKKLRENELARDLGKGSLETLAVIAYQGNVSRGEIDWVRGVNSSASLRILLMRGLIEGSEDAADKRRIRYDLTTEALAHLGIASVADLPRGAELRAETLVAIEEKSLEATAP